MSSVFYYLSLSGARVLAIFSLVVSLSLSLSLSLSRSGVLQITDLDESKLRDLLILIFLRRFNRTHFLSFFIISLHHRRRRLFISINYLSMMKFFFSLILLIICQYLFNPMTVDARPARVKKFSWAFPIHNEHDGIIRQPFVKRKGLGKDSLDSFLGIFRTFFFRLGKTKCHLR